jgi:hypothetical protein
VDIDQVCFISYALRIACCHSFVIESLMAHISFDYSSSKKLFFHIILKCLKCFKTQTVSTVSQYPSWLLNKFVHFGIEVAVSLPYVLSCVLKQFPSFFFSMLEFLLTVL